MYKTPIHRISSKGRFFERPFLLRKLINYPYLNLVGQYQLSNNLLLYFISVPP